MYLEYERRAWLAELDAKYYHPRQVDGVKLQEPNAFERALMALWEWLRAALARRGAIPKRLPIVQQHGAGTLERASCA